MGNDNRAGEKTRLGQQNVILAYYFENHCVLYLACMICFRKMMRKTCFLEFYSYFCKLFYEGVIGGKGRERCQQIPGLQRLGIARKQ